MLKVLLRPLLSAGAALARRWPVTVDGQTLDPRVQVVARFSELMGRPLDQLPPAEARVQLKKRQALAVGSAPPLAAVEDLELAGRPARLYRPRDARHGLLYFHGGGFVLGDLDSHDVCCRQLAAASSCTVLAVDYLLAPEHPFPAAVDDAIACWAALLDRREELGAQRWAVGGDSAGGNLAAVVCLHARDRGWERPAAQLLIYPSVDRASTLPSRELFDTGFLLTGELTDWFMDRYLQGHPKEDPRVSPMRWPTGHADLPPAVVSIAGFDILRDEARRYCELLRAGGAEVVEQEHEGLVHGYLQLDGAVPAARAATDAAGRALATLLRLASQRR